MPSTSVVDAAVDEDGIAHLDPVATPPLLDAAVCSCTYRSRRSSSLSDSEIAPGIAALRLPAFS